MKRSGLLAAAGLASTMFVSSALGADDALETCQADLSRDTETYSEALGQATSNKAENMSWDKKLSAEFLIVGLDAACSPLTPASSLDEIKTCLNAGADLEDQIMSKRTQYWEDLSDRFISIKDNGICLNP